MCWLKARTGELRRAARVRSRGMRASSYSAVRLSPRSDDHAEVAENAHRSERVRFGNGLLRLSIPPSLMFAVGKIAVARALSRESFFRPMPIQITRIVPMRRALSTLI